MLSICVYLIIWAAFRVVALLFDTTCFGCLDSSMFWLGFLLYCSWFIN